jgi:hypothetical protein
VKKIVFGIIMAVSFLTACTKLSNTDIGGGLIPPIDGIITKDTTFDIVTDLFENADTARVYKTDLQALGYLNDPLFGTTRASLFFQVKPPFFPYQFPVPKDSIVLDSAVLILKVAGTFGDTTQPLIINVNEVGATPTFSGITDYPTFYPGFITAPLSTGVSLAPAYTLDLRRLPDSSNNRFSQSTFTVRVPLNRSVGQQFINFDTTNAYKSDSAFSNFFQGLAISTNNSGNALLKISLADTNTRLALYYNYKRRDTINNGRDTAVTYFNFASFGAGQANFIVRNRVGTPMQTALTNGTPDSILYIQTTPGSFARLRINKGLTNLGNNIIHRAEIVMQGVQDNNNTLDDKLTPPRYLLLSSWDSSHPSPIPVKGILRNVPNDYIIDLQQGIPNIAQFGGFLLRRTEGTATNVPTYIFNITRYVQGIVTRKDSLTDLRLYAPSNDSMSYAPPYPNNLTRGTIRLSPIAGNDAADGRVRIGGGNHSRFRMRLRVIYSKL